MSAKKNGNKVFDIVSTIIVILLFLFGVACLILSFTGNTVYIFGTRYDVCLTDSMSVKNAKYSSFLKDYDNQIQPFDLVISKKVEKDSDLNVGDIVVYNNPYIGTDCHRVVDIVTYIKDEVNVNYATLVQDNGYYLGLYEVASSIRTNSMRFTTATLKLKSKVSYHNNFNFNISFVSYAPEVVETYKDGYYFIELTIKNKVKSSERLVISHQAYYDYEEDLISELIIDSDYGKITVLPNELEEISPNNFSQKYNESKKFEIRGDKASTSDGYFKIDQIHSKVTGVIPKIGFPIRFLSSIWGMVLIVGFILIVTLTDLGLSRIKDDNNDESGNGNDGNQNEIKEDKNTTDSNKIIEADEAPNNP